MNIKNTNDIPKTLDLVQYVQTLLFNKENTHRSTPEQKKETPRVPGKDGRRETQKGV